LYTDLRAHLLPQTHQLAISIPAGVWDSQLHRAPVNSFGIDGTDRLYGSDVGRPGFVRYRIRRVGYKHKLKKESFSSL
jgi:hypothetical protein